uniref:Uncharacterized protein n=1 Tax=Prevotella sp. GTC17254 TaxID=3236794 RepID=A0AB33ISR1_9BACT
MPSSVVPSDVVALAVGFIVGVKSAYTAIGEIESIAVIKEVCNIPILIVCNCAKLLKR